MEMLPLHVFPVTRNQADPIEELSEWFTIVLEEPQHFQVTYLETFDWRLYKNNWVLSRKNDRLILQDRKCWQELASCVFAGPATFVWDLPAGNLKDLLKPVLEMRALLERVRLRPTETRAAVLNEDRKTVVRLLFRQFRHKNLNHQLELYQVRGYPAEAQKLVRAMDQLGFVSSKVTATEMFIATGAKPLDYSSKPQWLLNREMRSLDAGKQVFASLLEVMYQNLTGIHQDIDSEFLHDFRVAVRRTRSGLSLFRDIFDLSTTQQARSDFSALGKITNRLRDLDVHLLDHAAYNEMLPLGKRNSLEIFFAMLQQERIKAQAQLSQDLLSSEVQDRLERWERFLEEPETSAGKGADVPLGQLADRVIWQTYKKIYREARQLNESSPDEDYHRLRIRCKKLRYALAFFSSLYPDQEVKGLEEKLKRLQNALGSFNDKCVQQEFLEEAALQIRAKGPLLRKVVLALGFLAGILYEQRVAQKNSCLSHIRDFSSRRIRASFKDLCQPGSEL